MKTTTFFPAMCASVAAALFLGGCASALPAATVPMPSDPKLVIPGPPQLQPGDTWVYQTKTGERFQEVVTKVDGGRAYLDYGGIPAVFTADWKLIKGPGSGVSSNALDFEPPLELFSFPLYPGKTWNQSYQYNNPAHSSWKGTGAMQAKVVGWEEVTVPAGSFHTLKIEYSGTWRNLYRTGTSGRACWLAPEVKTWVRCKQEDGQTRELVEYKVK